MSDTALSWSGAPYGSQPHVWLVDVYFRRDGELVSLRKLVTSEEIRAGVMRYVLRDMQRTMDRWRASHPLDVIADHLARF